MAQHFNLEQKSTELLNRLDLYIKDHLEELTDELCDCISKFGETIHDMQKKGEKGAVAYLQFSLLRTNILLKRHELRLDAYDKNWYLDKEECSASYEVREILRPLEEFASMAEALRLESPMNVTLQETQGRIFEESRKYMMFLAELIRLGMRKAVLTEGYQKIEREPVFVVCIGGLLDRVDILYKEDKTAKEGKEVRRYLQSKEQTLFSHEVYEKLDLSGGNYEGLKFLYSSFGGCDFTGSNWSRSQLMFSDFTGCILKDVQMTGIQMFDVDFTGAVLEHVSFAGAKLSHVSFEGAALRDVDFDGVLLMEEVKAAGATGKDTRIPER